MLTKRIAVILLTAFIIIPAFRIISFNAGIEDETTLVAASVVIETSEAVEEPQEVETTSIFSSEESETETEIPEEDIEIDVEDVGGGLGSSVIDICFEDHDEAEDFVRKFNVTVYRA